MAHQSHNDVEGNIRSGRLEMRHSNGGLLHFPGNHNELPRSKKKYYNVEATAVLI
jgi:hypothetical protein